MSMDIKDGVFANVKDKVGTYFEILSFVSTSENMVFYQVYAVRKTLQHLGQ